MRPHRIVAILVCLVPIGIAAIWLEVYALRIEQRITEMLERQDQMVEVNARLRATLAEYVSPELLAQHFDRLNKARESEGDAEVGVVDNGAGAGPDGPVWLTRGGAMGGARRQ